MVTSSPSLRFGPFILDQSTSSCGAGVSAALLAPKPLPSFGTWTAVPAGVAKEELLESAWPGVYVSGAALKVCIRESARLCQLWAGRNWWVGRSSWHGYGPLWLEPAPETGRCSSSRAKPRIGKTALTDAFLAEVTSTGESRIARGQCLQHYGAGEPYLPVLEAQQGLGGGHAEDGQLQLRVLSSPRFHELQDPA